MTVHEWALPFNPNKAMIYSCYYPAGPIFHKLNDPDLMHVIGRDGYLDQSHAQDTGQLFL